MVPMQPKKTPASEQVVQAATVIVFEGGRVGKGSVTMIHWLGSLCVLQSDYRVTL